MTTTTTRRLGSGTIALALATSAFAAPSAFAQDADAVAEIESGAVNWPIKESFNNYIKMPFVEGTITTDGGIVENGKSFDFVVNPDESELDADGNGTLQLDGSIHYQGHHGQLDLKYSDIKIVVTNGTDATITADYDLQGALPGQEQQDNHVQDAEISSFVLDEALLPESEASYEQNGLKTTFLQGAVDSLLNYDAGPVEDGDVDLSVTFAEVKDGEEEPTPDPDPTPVNSSVSSNNEGSADGGIIAAIVALIAAVGAAGAAAGGFIPGFDINKILKQFGL